MRISSLCQTGWQAVQLQRVAGDDQLGCRVRAGGQAGVVGRRRAPPGRATSHARQAAEKRGGREHQQDPGVQLQLQTGAGHECLL